MFSEENILGDLKDGFEMEPGTPGSIVTVRADIDDINVFNVFNVPLVSADTLEFVKTHIHDELILGVDTFFHFQIVEPVRFYFKGNKAVFNVRVIFYAGFPGQVNNLAFDELTSSIIEQVRVLYENARFKTEYKKMGELNAEQ